MLEKDYEYRGLMASTWDLFRGDTSAWHDRFFFKDMIEQTGSLTWMWAAGRDAC
jgi:hypothetical protein